MARRATTDEKQKAARKNTLRVTGRARLRFGRLLFGVLASVFVLFLLVWYAVHHFDWAGPLLANSLRALFGVEKVAKLEDVVYGAEDRVNRLLKKNEPPKAYWQVPSASAAPSAAALNAAPAAAAPSRPSEAFH